MSRALLRHTWRSNRVRLLVVCTAALLWGGLLPVVYSRFSSSFKSLFESGALPEAATKFGGGDIFSLSGVIALGLPEDLLTCSTCVPRSAS